MLALHLFTDKAEGQKTLEVSADHLQQRKPSHFPRFRRHVGEFMSRWLATRLPRNRTRMCVRQRVSHPAQRTPEAVKVSWESP